MKWLHRTLYVLGNSKINFSALPTISLTDKFSQVSMFLRSCMVCSFWHSKTKDANSFNYSLIPNLSYISEAAACVLDRQLRTFLVPYTDIVKLSSKAFHYDYWDRRAYYRRSKPLPPKVGSFQVFLQGFQGTQ